MSCNNDDDLLLKKAISNEEELISEILSQQNIEDLSNDENDVTACANCGKEGRNLNICNKCKDATYCNAVKRNIDQNIRDSVRGE